MGGVKRCKPKDLLFLWGGDLALLSYAITKILGRKRKILGQNLILHKKLVESRKTQKIRYWIYKKAFQSDNFHMTVNSEPLIKYYADWFGCGEDRFFLVNDSMVLNDNDKQIIFERGDRSDFYVFCGGKEMRDIEGFFKIVEMMPDIKFKAVFRKKDLPGGLPDFPNLELYHDTTREEFYRIMAGASICLIPLKSKSPCGLSVVQKAMLMGLNIISTDTPSMRTLIPTVDYGYLLPMFDYNGIIKSIREVYNNKSVREQQRQNAKKRMEIFSPDNVAKQLCNAIYMCYK